MFSNGFPARAQIPTDAEDLSHLLGVWTHLNWNDGCDTIITMPLSMDVQDVCKCNTEKVGISWPNALRAPPALTMKGISYLKPNTHQGNFYPAGVQRGNHQLVE